jgi:hypothetical protein
VISSCGIIDFVHEKVMPKQTTLPSGVGHGYCISAFKTDNQGVWRLQGSPKIDWNLSEEEGFVMKSKFGDWGECGLIPNLLERNIAVRNGWLLYHLWGVRHAAFVRSA